MALTVAPRKYTALNYPGSTYSGLTGIRTRKNKCHTQVFVTGFYRTAENTNSQSFIFQGNKRGKGIFHDLNFPSRPDLTVIATELYSLSFVSDSIIHAVGSVSTEELEGVQSCIYTGTLQGEGEWRLLFPNLSGIPIISSIAHSVMGDVVVGNYKTIASPALSSAYIYDIRTHQFFPMVTSQFPIISISNYGVWQDDGHHYTICGGLASSADAPEITVGFIADWNNRTRVVSHWRMFVAPSGSEDALITHFQGISAFQCGYTLAGQTTEQAYFVEVPHKKAKWEVVMYPGSTVTTSDSVAQNIQIGSFESADSGLQGYISYPSRH